MKIHIIYYIPIVKSINLVFFLHQNILLDFIRNHYKKPKHILFMEKLNIWMSTTLILLISLLNQMKYWSLH